MHGPSASLSKCAKGKGTSLPISALEDKYGEVEVKVRAFLTSALNRIEGLSNPGPYTAQERTAVPIE
jgi:hypothetical protein